VALGIMIYHALEAAEQLASEGISCEVVDPRTILPLDREAILDSVAKTKRAVIVHEAPKTGGVGGEIAAMIAEHAFSSLRSPVVRVGAPFTPLPRKPYEKLYLPNKEKIISAVKGIFS